MLKPFRKLIAPLPARRKKAIRARVRKELELMALQELRRAVELTQVQLADALHMNQAAVSKMERQSDMYISTLRKMLRAMGAELQIVARFPDRDVVIDQFGN